MSVGSFRLAPVSPEHGMKWMSFFGLKPTFFKNGTSFSLHSSYLWVQATGGMSTYSKQELKLLHNYCNTELTFRQTDLHTSSYRWSKWSVFGNLLWSFGGRGHFEVVTGSVLPVWTELWWDYKTVYLGCITPGHRHQRTVSLDMLQSTSMFFLLIPGHCPFKLAHYSIPFYHPAFKVYQNRYLMSRWPLKGCNCFFNLTFSQIMLTQEGLK